MDDYYSYYKFIVLGGLLILSALFSGAEVALFSLERKKIIHFQKSKNLAEFYIFELLEAPRRLLVTILVGNTLFNVSASIIAVAIALDFSSAFEVSTDIALTVEIILLTLLILFFGEVTPKILATKNPLKFAKVVVIPLYWIGVIIYPVSKFLTVIIKSFASKINLKNRSAITSEELSDLANIGFEKGTIEEEEQELIEGIVTFRTISAKEVMTPRVDMTAVSLSTTFDELLSLITESGHSRLPLYNNDLDDIIGIIYAKDLLPFISNGDSNPDLSLRKIARKAMFIPESKLINELLEEFQTKKMHMGIVVDEYGGTAGLVSMEDILEEIVGDIHDEYDKEEEEIVKINDNKYLLLGKLDIDELTEIVDEELSDDEDDFDTVGGFIFDHSGNIPEEGFTFVFNDRLKFTVTEVDNNRINRVELEIIKEK